MESNKEWKAGYYNNPHFPKEDLLKYFSSQSCTSHQWTGRGFLWPKVNIPINDVEEEVGQGENNSKFSSFNLLKGLFNWKLKHLDILSILDTEFIISSESVFD